MKRIIKVSWLPNKHYADVMFRFDTGEEIYATLTKPEYDIQIIKEGIFDFLSVTNVSATELKNTIKQIEEIESLKWQEGYDSGYDAGYDSGYESGQHRGIDET